MVWNQQYTYLRKLCEIEGDTMEQLIEEYGMGVILVVIGIAILAALGKGLEMIAGVYQ